jgi:hypothetical protein
MELKVLNIAVVAGTSATITIAPLTAEDYRFYKMVIGQTIPANVGTEPVVLTDGTTEYPLIDNAGNVVVLGKLRGLRTEHDAREVRVAKYRLQYGSNGLPAAIPHFAVKEGLAELIYNGTAGSLDDDAAAGDSEE